MGLFLAILLPASAEDVSFFKQGQDLLQSNRPEEAAFMLQAAKDEQPGNEKVYLYLAFSYEQMGTYARAVETLKEGLNSATLYRKEYYLNLGNNYFKLGQYKMAEEMFTQAIKADTRFSEAYLNRANSRMSQEQYESALADYRMYLTLDPDSRQKDNINKIISMLSSYIAEAEKRRQEEEQRRKEEEERQKQLLDSVLKTLDTIGSDTQNLPADSEDIIEYEDGLDILE